MGLGSSSITMLEMVRAYSAFATYGELVEPTASRGRSRTATATCSSSTEPSPPSRPGPHRRRHHHLAAARVATAGTAAPRNSMGIHAAGKTGTTNDFRTPGSRASPPT
ncbi:MAG: hypothetical protein H6741_10950 [Alphaproteobacteria bacterium]|nr:hypothetical protein [Alphaproteobacteria bacterium]